MKDEHKTKQQLVAELTELRQRITKLEAVETERKQAEEQNRKFSKIIETTIQSVIITNIKGTVIYVNPSYCSFSGFGEDEVIGNSMFRFAHKKGAIKLAKEVVPALVKTGHWHGDMTVVKKNEQIVSVDLVCSLISDEKNKPEFFVAIFSDMTERKQAEEALKKRTEEIELLYEAGRQLGQTLDIETIYRQLYEWVVNSIDCDGLFISSYDPEKELIRCDFAITEGNQLDPSRFPPIPLEPEGQGSQSVVIRTGEPMLIRDYQARIETATTAYHVDEEGTVVGRDQVPQDEDVTRSALIIPVKLEGKVVGVIQAMSFRLDAYTVDDLRMLESLASQIAVAGNNALLYQQARDEITQRKQAEEAIQKSEEKYRLLADNSIDVIWKTDLKLIFTYTSPSIKKVFGYTVKEWVGTRLSQHTSTKEFFNIARKALHAIKNYKTIKHLTFDAVMLRKDGTEIPVEIAAKLLLNKKGLPIGLQGTTHDITERKRAEEALQQYTERLRILREIDQAILAAQSPEDIAQAAMAHVRELVPCQRASVTIFDQEAEGATVLAVHTNGETVMEVGARVPLDTFGLTGELGQGQAHTVDDLRAVSTPSPMEQMLLTGDIRSYVNVPLIAQGELIGALNLGAGELAAFGKQQIKIAHEVADQLAIAIRQARLYEASQRQSEELATLLEVSQGLAVTLDLGTVLQTAIEGAVQVMGLGSGAIYLIEGEELYLEATTPPQFPEEFRRAPLADHPHIHKALTTGHPVILPDTTTADLTPAERAVSEARGLRSIVYTPLMVAEQAVGALILATTGESRGFSEAEINLCRTLSSQIALAVENARLYESVQRHAAELEGRVTERTVELDRRVAEVEQLNRGMTNLLDDLQAANRHVTRTARRLEQTNVELESFTHSVSHDLRAPLRHVDSFAKLLLEREAARLEPTSARYLQNIVAATDKMRQLIDDLLALSRTGRAEMHLRPVAPNEIIEKARQYLAPTLAGRRITWEIAPLPAVQADPGLLRVVWDNLLSNAVKYTGTRPEARIEIGATPPDEEGWVTFFIRDNGVGFDPQYTHKLFGTFQRLHRDEEFEGSGIGLATVRRIIHRHGGRVWAEGEPDRGATFYFTLSVLID